MKLEDFTEEELALLHSLTRDPEHVATLLDLANAKQGLHIFGRYTWAFAKWFLILVSATIAAIKLWGGGFTS